MRHVVTELEGKLTSELQDPSIAVASDFTERTRSRGSADRLHVGVVRRVEGLRTELEGQPLDDSEVAEDTKIEATEARALDSPALRGARDDAGRRRRSKGPGVEPQRRSRLVSPAPLKRNTIALVRVTNLIGA